MVGIDDVKNIISLYDLRDSARIKRKAVGKNVIIMGSGFIAMELLQPLNSIAKSIKVIQRSRRPYGLILGDTIGRLVQQMCAKRYSKVEFVGCDEVKKVIGNNTKEISSVITLKKRELKCELLIYAIGGVPNTEFLQFYPKFSESKKYMLPNTSLGMHSSGFIPVNEVCP